MLDTTPTTRSRQGSSLVGVMLVLLLLSAVCLSLFSVGFSSVNNAEGAAADAKARALAETAIEEALYDLRTGGTGSLGSRESPLQMGGGVYWVQVQPIDAMRVRLQSAALVGSGRASMAAVAEVSEFETVMYPFAIFSIEDAEMNSAILIDSWNPELGTSYEDQLGTESNELASVGSNGSIELESPGRIQGNVLYGVRDEFIGDTSQVSGTVGRQLEDATVPPIEEPESFRLYSSSMELHDTLTLTGPDWEITSLDVRTGGKLILEGPGAFKFTDLVLNAGAEIEIRTTNGPVDIYVDGVLDLDSNSVLHTTEGPSNGTTLYLTGGRDQEVHLDSNAEFYGRMYAPDAAITVDSNFHFFGALTARSVTLEANCHFTYDASMRNEFEVEEASDYVLTALLPTGFPERDLQVNRSDPFLLLGVEGEGDLGADGDWGED